MAAAQDRANVETLLRQEKWAAARALIKQELAADPDNHWLLTQLGSTFYEQRRYREALEPLLAARAVVPDCPLALWHLAGTLDALGKPREASAIYTWLLRSDASPDDDPCWESAEWAAALKADCTFRLGVCARHSGRKAAAERYFRQYLNMLLAGATGLYSFDDTLRHIRELRGGGNGRSNRDIRAVIDSTLRPDGRPVRGAPRKLPDLRVEELLAS